ncbi:hypothetical protein CC85DRAFT_198786 [Cutaneotrichosporon oleaginosum]|uniref:CCHC-type domain-containing protein n=1 Tax=Cutaneotrichosporon oleaginosum TaxID=879819 RepID=A0A0J0XE05_9TREE|nr:uncharacterized protein CC85DRAFT_198786 [Cutaneotrichosporon oleaginosum]KLT39312.1 hypothetical protein CC85DRAFT_198786 [Cutaneotrichosporon oleaginosum]TXT08569.1 hypothetical protein COLE_05493 [Cutaneotrichosporon oleaginosum]
MKRATPPPGEATPSTPFNENSTPLKENRKQRRARLRAMEGNPDATSDGASDFKEDEPQQSQQSRNKRRQNEGTANEYYDFTKNSGDEACSKCGLAGHSVTTCTTLPPPYAEAEPRAGPSGQSLDGGEGTSTINSDDPGAPSKFKPFRRMAISVTLPESDDEEEGDDGRGSGAKEQKTSGGMNSKRSSPPAPPPGSPPPPPLLLPAHVSMGDEDQDAVGQDAPPLDVVVENTDMTGIAVLDDSRATGAVRYYDPRATDEFFASADLRSVCKKCKKPGHTDRNCDVEICLRCGEEGHERNSCPYGQTCRYCGLSGHSAMECKQRAVQAHDTGTVKCTLCGSNRHGTTGCELAWRTYVYYPPDVREEVVRSKSEAKGWKLEAVGKNPMSLFCFNCAREGHLGDVSE